MIHRRMVAIINSIKHYVVRTNSVVATGAIQSNILVDAVVAPATAATFEVIQGAVIKAVFIELWLFGNENAGTTTQFVATVEKLIGGAAAMTNAQALNLGSYPNKKNILYTTQGVVGSFKDGQSSVPVIRGWIKIPKGKQRFGLADQLRLNVAAVGALRNCGIFIYKEYR